MWLRGVHVAQVRVRTRVRVTIRSRVRVRVRVKVRVRVRGRVQVWARGFGCSLGARLNHFQQPLHGTIGHNNQLVGGV